MSMRGADPDLDLLLPSDITAESEALAELFLGNAPLTPHASPPTPARPSHLSHNSPTRDVSRPMTSVIEGLVLGHLPVLASAWVQQYARHVAAERRGPVALLRLRANEAILELVSGSGVIHQPHEDPAANLAEALGAAARESNALLVRTDETTEPRLAELAGLDSLTLLSGADEAATVASYRTIKNLTSRMDDEARHPAIRLAIMGATSIQAHEASAKIERAASAFLNRGVSVTACISKIGGGKSTPLFKGPIVESVEATLRNLRQMFVATPTRTSPRHSPAPPAPVQINRSETPTQSRPEPVVSRLGNVSASSAPIAGITLPRLCDHIGGLAPAPFTCPYASDIEFALDSQGNLHVLGHLDHHSRDLTQMLTASEWARSHDSLLRQLLPKAGPTSTSITIHAFTSQAISARLLPPTLRVHLLAQINVAGKDAWFSTPLN